MQKLGRSLKNMMAFHQFELSLEEFRGKVLTGFSVSFQAARSCMVDDHRSFRLIERRLHE
jgi:hypothetical protein